MMRNMVRLLLRGGKVWEKRPSRLPVQRACGNDRTSPRQLGQLALRRGYQVFDDLPHGLDLPDEGDALARHQRPVLDVAVHDRAAKGAYPELLEFHLGLLAGNLP